MSSSIYFLLEGLSHISDLGAYDHILFIAALAALYQFRDWKSLLGLVTAFTIGHSIALALATFQLLNIPSELVEFLIPVTIIITCISNLFAIKKKEAFHVEHNSTLDNNMFHVEQSQNKTPTQQDILTKINGQTYLISTIFGLIHGVGFSNYLRFMLAREETITIPLLMFNLGLEFGQIIILFAILILNFVSLKILGMTQKTWTIGISILILLSSIPILSETSKALF
jgi:hypothetical protein